MLVRVRNRDLSISKIEVLTLSKVSFVNISRVLCLSYSSELLNLGRERSSCIRPDPLRADQLSFGRGSAPSPCDTALLHRKGHETEVDSNQERRDRCWTNSPK